MSERPCPHCGADHGPEARFCSITGAALSDAPAAPASAKPGAGRRAGSETIMMFARPTSAAPAADAALDITVKAPPHGAAPVPVPEQTIEERLPEGLRAAATAATAPLAGPEATAATAPTIATTPAAPRTATPTGTLVMGSAAATIVEKAAVIAARLTPPPVPVEATIATAAVAPPFESPAAVDASVAHPRSPTPAGAEPSEAAAVPQTGDDRTSGRVSGAVVGEASVRTSGKIPAWAVSPDDGGPDLGEPAPAASPLNEFAARVRRSFAIYADNVVPLLILAGAILGPPSVIAAGLTATFTQVVPNAGLLALNFLLTFLVMGAAWPLCTAAVVVTVISYLKGQPFGPAVVGDVLRTRAKSLGLALLPVGVAIALGYLLFVIPGILAQIFFALVPTVVLLEGKQGGAALKRSATLIRDMLAPAVGVFIAFGLLAFVLTRLLTAILPGIGGIDLIVAALASIALAPLPMIALGLLYRRLRLVQDGVGDDDIVRTLRGE
ncbi:MAG TPA: hypothetical protein VGF45_19605 [Polyangia bacterium]